MQICRPKGTTITATAEWRERGRDSLIIVRHSLGSARRFGKSTANNTLSYQELSLGRSLDPRSRALHVVELAHSLPTRIFRYSRRARRFCVIPSPVLSWRTALVGSYTTPSTTAHLQTLHPHSTPYTNSNTNAAAAAVGYSSLFLKDRLSGEREIRNTPPPHHHHLVTTAFIRMSLVSCVVPAPADRRALDRVSVRCLVQW